MRALRFVLIIAGMLAALVGMTPVASADPSPDIIGGGNAASAPWAARMFNNGQQRCSATIIAPTFILTAKHCVNGTTPSGVTFRIGSLDQLSGGTVARAVAYSSHPVADFSIVRIDRSVSATFSPLSATNVTVGQTVQIYGWGATCTNQPEINCQARLIKVANVRVTTPNGRDAFGGIAISATRINGIAAGGDSGGPMFGNGRQVGVASTSDRATRTNYTNITQYRSFIRSVAGV